MSPRHVLILGGHGKISQHLTPLLLANAHTVTSVIRADDQAPAIRGLRPADSPGTLNVLVRSLEDLTDAARARALLDEVRPDAVFFSAGAGGKGDPQRTFAIDRDAASHLVQAAAGTGGAGGADAPSTVRKFVLVSYLASRRRRPAWWDDKAWADAEAVNAKLARYYQAKIVADEVLYEAGARRGADFVAVDLRPGTLSEEPAGPVELGRTKAAGGQVSRASVAAVAAALLENDAVRSGWLDLLDGEEDIAAAVERVARDGVDAAEGEPVFEKVNGQA